QSRRPNLHRGRSCWFLVAMACLGVAVFGSGCERTISDSNFIPAPPGDVEEPIVPPAFCDDACQRNL
ncbi:MAG: hypothetical protein AAEJ52_03855, partial [Myxococcota bacterium]